MDKKKNIALNDDGELTFNTVGQKNRKSGRLKVFLLILVTVIATYLSVEPLEDLLLKSLCDRSLVVDILSSPATTRSRHSRRSSVVGYVEAGPRHIIIETYYDKTMNDCWAKIKVDGTTGWLLTLIDKH